MKGMKQRVNLVKQPELDAVKNFDELATQLQYTKLAKQAQIDARRIKKLFGNGVGDMTLSELYKISSAIGMHYERLTDLAIEKMDPKVKQKTKRG
jgi:hypothetical protein